MGCYAQLLFDLPLDGPFTYAIGEALIDSVEVGRRVKVDFRNRKMTGYVIALTDEVTGSFTIKEIERVIDKEPVFGEETIALAEWMGKFYLCSHGQALSLAFF